MNKILSVLLIEDDETACNEFKRNMANLEDMKLVDVTNNANKALDLVLAHLPNVIILDLELHHGGGNGLKFMNDLKNLHLDHMPFILVTTNNMSDVTLEQAKAFGADLTLTKYEEGYSAQYVIDNIRLMRTAILKKNAKIAPLPALTPAQEEQLYIKRIQRELELVGINPKATGYKYLVDSILLLINNPEASLARTLAPKYQKSEKSIERAMQNAIKQAWNTNDIEDLLEYYTAKIRMDKGCPTMMEFIWYYTTKIKSEMDFAEVMRL